MEGLMHPIQLFDLVTILLLVLFFMSISFKLLVLKMPVIVSGFMYGGFFAILLLNSFVRDIAKIHSHPYSLISGILYLASSVTFIIYYGFFCKLYLPIGIRSDDLRERLLSALDADQIKREEKLNKVLLPEINNELIISRRWIGFATIRLKSKKGNLVFSKIIKTFALSFENNPIKLEKGVAIFYAILGIVYSAILWQLLCLFLNK
jgi:hypothetical protein